MKNLKPMFSQLYLLGLLCLIPQLSYGLEGKTSSTLSFPLRGAFYYVWYPQTWTVGGEHVSYDVELGYYSSDDPNVVDQHIQDMDYANIDVAIASWWGIDKHNQAQRIPMLLDQTVDAGSDLKWAIYYEKEGFGNPGVEEIRDDLDYLMQNYADHDAFARIDGKPVIFIYNADDRDCQVADRWAEASNGEWYVNLKVFGGFGDCLNQPDSWHQYGPASSPQRHRGYSYVISPGFWRADEAEPRLERDINRWYKDIRSMIASKEPWQLITTYNEWGEGTAIERCFDWSSDTEYGLYLDALHVDGNPADSKVVTASQQNPVNFYLHNYPNPFNPTTMISFVVPQSSHVSLKIFSTLGHEIKTLVNRTVEFGERHVIWDGTDNNGNIVTSGVYVYRLESEFGIDLKKMLFVK